MGLVDFGAGFLVGQNRHQGFAMVMGHQHDIDGLEHVEGKNAGQDHHHKIHRGNIVVFDDDTVGLLK